jgi:superoxide dismutase, Fe-Mn family
MSSVKLARASTTIAQAPLVKSAFKLDRVQGLSGRAIELHLGLYETYVKEANAVLEQLHDFPRHRELTPGERLQRDGLVRRLAFELNGVSLHQSFFEALSGPGSAPVAGGVFSQALQTHFGGFENWKQDVAELANTRGVGWVVCLHSQPDDRLINVWVDDHTRGLLPGLTPIAVFDLWEHAYLLDFKPSQRGDYLKVLFENMNWNVVESRCG